MVEAVVWSWFFGRRKSGSTERQQLLPSGTASDHMRDSYSGNLPMQATHNEIMSYPRLGTGLTGKDGSAKADGRNIILLVVLLAGLVGCAIAISYWRIAKAPGGQPPPRERAKSGGAAYSKEAEAEAVEDAIADKPEELRQSLFEYAESSEDIRRILGQGLEEQNIGGAVAVAITNLQKNRNRGIDAPEQLGFRRIDHDKALVNRALRGEVDIIKVTISSADDHLFEVTIEFKNNTEFPLECVIPKGQLVEIRNARNAPTTRIVNAGYGASEPPQTAASTGEETDKGGVTVVPPWEPTRIKFNAYCANPDLPKPEGPANLTIYALEDTSYRTSHELRVLRRKKLNLPLSKNSSADIGT